MHATRFPSGVLKKGAGPAFRCAVLGVSILLLALAGATPVFAQFSLGDAANFAVLYEGGGTNNKLNVNTFTINGNVGVGGSGLMEVDGGGVVTGNVEFSAPFSSGLFTETGNGTTGPVSYGNTNVQTDLNNLNTLNSTLGAETGTSLSVNLNNMQSQTIQASSGTLIGGNEVFTATAFTLNNGATLTVNGTSSQYVVINIPFNVSFDGTIDLTGGITSDHVLWNVVGGSGLTGGPTLQGVSNEALLTGTFLDPNGQISINNTMLNGRVFGGDSSNEQLVSGGDITAPPTPTVPEPASMALLGTALLGAYGLLRRKLLA